MDKTLSDSHILVGGRGITRWVIVGKNDTCRVVNDSVIEDLARVDHGSVKRTKRDKLSMNRAAARVQAKDDEVLLPGAPHRSETRIDLLGADKRF